MEYGTEAILGIIADEVARTRDFVGAETDLEVSRNLVAEVIAGFDGMAVSYRIRSEVAVCA